MPELTLFSVFLVGLLGGFHCAGMCGGIVVLLNRGGFAPELPAASFANALPAGETIVHFGRRPVRGALSLQLAYSGGRVLSYTVAGGLMGALGSSSLLVGHLLPVEQLGFVLVNLLMLAFALYLWGFARSLSWLEPLGARLWARLSPIAGRRLAPGSLGNALAAGALWGWLPCGMVYGMLIAALASQSAREGALLLAAFGLGTLPNLVALGLGADRLMRAARRLWVRRFAAILLGAYAVAGLLRLDPRAHLLKVVDACLNWVMP